MESSSFILLLFHFSVEFVLHLLPTLGAKVLSLQSSVAPSTIVGPLSWRALLGGVGITRRRSSVEPSGRGALSTWIRVFRQEAAFNMGSNFDPYRFVTVLRVCGLLKTVCGFGSHYLGMSMQTSSTPFSGCVCCFIVTIICWIPCSLLFHSLYINELWLLVYCKDNIVVNVIAF